MSKYKGKEISKMRTEEIEKEADILIKQTSKLTSQLIKNSEIVRIFMEELIFRGEKPSDLEL